MRPSNHRANSQPMLRGHVSRPEACSRHIDFGAKSSPEVSSGTLCPSAPSTIRLIAVFAMAGLLCMSAVSPRLPAQDKPAAATPKKAEPEELKGHADVMKKSWGAKKITWMKGNVEFVNEDTVLTSDEVEFDENTQVAVSPGRLRITNAECDVTGDKGVTYFRKRTGVVEGNVVMLLKPKKSEKNAGSPDSTDNRLKEPTTVTCPRLEYNYRKKIAVATGGVVFKQAKRSATADKAVYDQTGEFLVLTGNVKGVDEDGQTFSAPGKVEISLKEGDEWMRAENATATFKVQIEEEESGQ